MQVVQVVHVQVFYVPIIRAYASHTICGRIAECGETESKVFKCSVFVGRMRRRGEERVRVTVRHGTGTELNRFLRRGRRTTVDPFMDVDNERR